MNLVPIERAGAASIDAGELPAEASAVLEATAGLYQLVGFDRPDRASRGRPVLEWQKVNFRVV